MVRTVAKKVAARTMWAPWSARVAIAICAALLLGYTVLRGIHVSFSWDESWSYIHYVIPREYFQTAFNEMGANHHLLNVWGMIACDRLFGNSELALRIPNLLAHIIFLYATARIALQARSGTVALACFLILNAHPYLLDFFALARGYGMAIGWMMLSLWMATRYFKGGRRSRWLAWAMCSAVLSALSNLTMLDYLLALSMAFAGAWWAEALLGMRKFPWRHAGIVIAGVCLGMVAILPIAIPLSQGEALFFGCDSILNCLVGSLGKKLLYSQDYGWSALTITTAMLVLIGTCCAALAATVPRGFRTERLGMMAFGALLATACLAIIRIQQLVLDTPVPKDRTALFLVPLLLFIPVSGMVAWPAKTWLPKVAGTLLCLPLLIHLAKSANLTHSEEWKPEGEVSKMLDLIAAENPPLQNARPLVSLATSFESWGCIPYYRIRSNLQGLVVNLRNAPDPYVPSNYYIVEWDGLGQIDTLHWELMYHSGPTGTSLFRDKRNFGQSRRVEHSSLDMEAPGIQGRSDEQHASGYYSVRFDAKVRSTNRLNWIVSDTIGAGMAQLYGTALTLQPKENNWVALVLRVARGTKELAMSNLSPAVEARYPGQWAKIAVALVPMVPLLPGDTVQLSAWPMYDSSVMYIDDMELWVVRK